MNFQEKISLFNKELPFFEKTVGDLKDLSVRISSHKNIYFEKNIDFNSPMIVGSGGILLGAYSYMNDGGYIRENTVIGRYCSIGRRVSIGAGGHAISAVSTSSILRRGIESKQYTESEKSFLGVKSKNLSTNPTIIGHDCWIGDGAIIFPGIKIGEGCVIGSNAVVRDDLKPYTINGGIPSRILRQRFPDELIKQLLQLNIFELDHGFLKSSPLENIFEFISFCRAENPPLSDLLTFKIKQSLN
jgi:virginiamycin A acetyltransferase